MSDFIDAMREAANEKEFRNDLKLEYWMTSTHPGTVWKTYIGDKKCCNCDKTADIQAFDLDDNQKFVACALCAYKLK